ncbi:uncharacterized protein TNCV_563851 [Trichonephila clavipes]|nr:uncharacterized protein TNCV_563851 [Trichonephila clavipes]
MATGSYLTPNYSRSQRGRVVAEDDEPPEHLRLTITGQNIAKIRDMNGFLLTSVFNKMGFFQEKKKGKSSKGTSKDLDQNYYQQWQYRMQKRRAVGSLVVRASDSRPEGLGSMLDVTKYPPSAHGFTCRNCGGGDRGRVAIYRPFGEVSLSLNRTVTCMVLKANDRRTSCTSF